MALLEYSEDFELDDDGILRDSNSSEDYELEEANGYLLDDDGILRDDYDIHSSGKYASTHWTDSGFGGSKQSAGSTSTLRQFDLQSYPSYDSVSHPLDDDHENISDLEASKDDLSFDQDGYPGYQERGQERGLTPTNDKSVRSSHSSYNNSLTFDDTDNLRRSTDSGRELFDEEYYKQLRELGVLVDGADLVDDKDSLQEFEHLEQHVSKDDINFEEKEDGPAFDDYLRATPTPQEEENDDSVVPNLTRSPGPGHDIHNSPTRPTTATSLRTLSRGSFPEISPEEALELYKENLESRDFEDATSIDLESSQRTNDDDEIFLITSKISDTPKPGKRRAYQNDQDVPSMSPSQRDGNRIKSNRSFDRSFDRAEREIRNRSQSHQNRGQDHYSEEVSYDGSDYDSRGHTPFSREGSVTPDKKSWRRSGSTTPTRPDSATSQRSTTSDRGSKTPARQKTEGNLSRAKSQDSSLEKSGGVKQQNSEKMPKRLLPKPTASEDSNKNFRVKSKSTTNIAAKFGPMKPSHMSLVDLSHINIDEPDSETQSASSDKAKTELSSKLRQEFHKRKQATELVQQLQMDYDKLLSKYAMAELTIDQLRLGAKITLHSDSPTPSQATIGSLPGAQQQQMFQLGPGRAVKSPSPFQGSISSPLSQDSLLGEVHNDRLQEQRYKARSQSDSGLLNGHNGQMESRSQESGAESVKIGLLFQARSLDDRMESFKTLLEEKQLNHDEKEKVFDQIRLNHERLRHDYLQSKEDYNVLKRSTPNLADINFDHDKELEGELFRLGMKFDEIHEAVEQSEKEKASQRQPFQKKTVDAETSDLYLSDEEGRSVDQMKRKMTGTNAGDDLIEPKQNSEFEQKVKRLHEEYNALMDRYRRLKQMAQTPERDKEIDNLVRKLRNICDDEPDIFKMPKELNQRNNAASSNSSVAASSRSSSTNWLNEEIESSSPEEIDMNDGWEQLHDRDEEARLLGRRRPSEAITENGPVQNGVRRKESYASVENQSFIRGEADNPNASMENAFDRSRSQDMNGDLTRESGLPGSFSISGSRSSLSSRDSRGRSPRDFDQSLDRDSPHLPRPRRHDLRDPRRLERKKHNMSASLQSLGDSGISDQENNGASGGGALSNLPGPGKFKEMTKQRNAHDADSGFIGSIVGSEVSQMSARQQQQQQPTLRLRGPTASPRPSSRQRDSDSSMASARARPNDRPPSRESNRSRNKREKSGQTNDYTDDSYTLTTESEMSFEIPAGGRGGKRRGGSLENTIEEEEEGSSVTFTTLDESRDSHIPYLNMGQPANKKERPRSKLSQHSTSSHRSKNGGSPQKSKPKSKPQASKSAKVSDDDLTPRATPNQSFSNSFNQSLNRTSELYSSEEETPRQTVNRSLQNNKPMKAFPIDSKSKVEGPSTPRSKGSRTPTPRSVRAETPVKKQDIQKTEIVRPRSAEFKPQVKDMAVGSDSEATADDSVAETTATRGSTGSDRLKILQDEIGRLREEFQKATHQQRQALQQQLQQQPQPIPQPTNQNQDQYFDPTEDPYAFMRGPRRRANSFSGAPARDWDDWFRYPLQHNADVDIPLGYAAADSYAAQRPPPEVLPEPPRSRQRTRVRRRQRPGVTTETQTMNGYDSDQSPTRATASTVTEDQLFEYYVPRYYTAGNQSSQQRAPTMQRYSSQPNLAFTTTPPPPPAPPISNQQVPISSYAMPISAGYRTQRRTQRPARIPTSPYQRLYTFDDIDGGVQNQGQPAGYVLVEPQPQVGQVPRPAAPPQFSVRTDTCPMCGGSSYHTHGDYVYEVPVENQPTTYVLQGSPRSRPPRPRRRSKSASRVRHYSPDGRRRSKYIVKEYYTESSSAESDDDILIRRGRNRRRRRGGRKYRKAHSVTGNRIRARSDYDDDLNHSLNLTEEIDDLTRKMMDTVDGELRRARRKKEFGSSVW